MICIRRTCPKALSLIVSVALFLATTSCFAAELKYAVTLPLSSTDDGRSSQAIATYIELYASVVNAQLAVPNGHNISLITLDSGGSPSHAVGSVFKAKNASALAIVGDLSSDETLPMALAAQQQDLYMCSGSATSTKLSNMNEYPAFFRTIPSDTNQGIVLARFIKHMQWSACAMFASSSQYGRSIARGFLQAAQEVGVGVLVAEHIPFRSSARDRDAVMARVLGLAADSGIRIFVFLGTDAEFIHLARAARNVGLLGPEAVWLGSEGLAPLALTAASDPAVKEVTQGLLYVFPHEAVDQQQVQSLVERAQSKLATRTTRMEPYAAGFCDCLFALTAMFVEKLKDDPIVIRSPINGSDPAFLEPVPLAPVAQLLQPFQGLTGHVVFNSENSRDTPFVVYNMFDGVATQVFTIDGVAGMVEKLASPRYFSGTLTKPLERPSWVISFVQYFTLGGWVVLVVSGLLASIIAVCTFSLVVYRRAVYVREHSLPVLLLVALGLLLFLSTPIAWMDQQSVATCNAAVWLSGAGMQLIVLPLLYRSFQTWRACENIMLWKRPISNAFVTVVIVITLFLIESVFLFSWTYLAPLKPAILANATSFSFVCRSGNSDIAHHLLTAAHVSWHLGLIWSLVFFTNATRWLRTPARSQHYTHYVAVNLILCSSVGSIMAVVLHFASFVLAAFWIYTLMVWYTVCFTLAMLHVCVLQRVGNPTDPSLLQDAADPLFSLLAQRYGRMASGRADGYTLKSFEPMHRALVGVQASGLGPTPTLPRSTDFGPGSSGAGDGLLVPLPGKPATFIGDFAVKFPRVFSTWTLHRMIIALDEGYLGVMKKMGGVEETEIGRLWRLRDLSSRLVPHMDLVLEVRSMGEPIMFVQLNVEDQVEEMVHLMPDHQVGCGMLSS